MGRVGQLSTEYIILASIAILVTIPLFMTARTRPEAGMAYTAASEMDRNCDSIAKQIEQAHLLGRSSQLSAPIHLPEGLDELRIEGDEVILVHSTRQGRIETVCRIDVAAKVADQGLLVRQLKAGKIELQYRSKGPFVCVGPIGSDCTITECFDGLDNDGNGCTDTQDTGCSGPNDGDEEGGFCCGNGRLDTGEECDSPMMPLRLCTDLDTSYLGGTLGCGAPTSPAPCAYDTGSCHKCGNGAHDAGEDCDCGADGSCSDLELEGTTCDDLGYPGGALSCTVSCRFDTAGCTTCGNRVIDAPETCDDGNADDHDACPGTCQAASCGDGYRWWTQEECDDGLVALFDGCEGCTLTRYPGCEGGGPQGGSGSPVFAKGIELAASSLNRRSRPIAGESFAPAPFYPEVFFDAPPVQCNDGNANNNDACLVNCQRNVCGDGFVNIGVEECDQYVYNSNTIPDRCRLDCRNPRCGDGVQDAGEGCDDGNADQRDLCLNACVPSACGDGFRQAPNGQGQNEECDGTDLNGKTCLTLGLRTGRLSCYPTCTYDTRRCTGSAGDGDGEIE